VSRRTIGIVDCGVGNHASVWRAFHALDYRCRVSADRAVLGACDLLVLPGVGAFPAAMSALHERGLVEFLRDAARAGKPMVGLCLGMQLLADSSLEHGFTAGLGIIPGQVVPLQPERWHIGWNTVEVVNAEPLLLPSDGQSVYFNHSYVFNAPAEYQVCVARLGRPLTVGVRRGSVVGLQFHPEKSQGTGRAMLTNVVEGLCRA
jgi:glutamine amidotransferase